MLSPKIKKLLAGIAAPKTSIGGHRHKLKKLPAGYLPHTGTEPPVPDGTFVMLAIHTMHGISTAGPRRTEIREHEGKRGAGIYAREWAVPKSQHGAILGYLPVEANGAEPIRPEDFGAVADRPDSSD